MKNSTEQYRVGFEAWARKEGYELRRDASGFYFHGHAAHAWRVWVAAKIEASTEPSAQAEYPASEYQPGQWWLAELEKHWGHGESSNDTKRAAKVACNFASAVFAERAAGALSDDAKDAARYRFMRSEATGNFIRFVPYGKPIEIDEAIDAAIEAHKAGSGKGEA